MILQQRTVSSVAFKGDLEKQFWSSLFSLGLGPELCGWLAWKICAGGVQARLILVGKVHNPISPVWGENVPHSSLLPDYILSSYFRFKSDKSGEEGEQKKNQILLDTHQDGKKRQDWQHQVLEWAAGPFVTVVRVWMGSTTITGSAQANTVVPCDNPTPSNTRNRNAHSTVSIFILSSLIIASS